MKPISELIPNAVARANIGQQVEAVRVVASAERAIHELFPNETATVRALSVKNKVLTISCVSAALAQEIKMREKVITERVNKELGDTMIERIRYLL